MSMELYAVPSFAAHQTFHPRFGWIKKGYDADWTILTCSTGRTHPSHWAWARTWSRRSRFGRRRPTSSPAFRIPPTTDVGGTADAARPYLA